MKHKNFEETKELYEFDNSSSSQYKKIKKDFNTLKKRYFYIKILFCSLIIINIIIIIKNYFFKSTPDSSKEIQNKIIIDKETRKITDKNNEGPPKENDNNNKETSKIIDKNIIEKRINFLKPISLHSPNKNINCNDFNNDYFKETEFIINKEQERPHFELINKKRTFEKRLPLTSEIGCKPHFTENELGAFLSFLTKDTIYFETGSGCSSVIAKYYAKKSYAVEGCKEYYDKGIANGLKDNLIFKDLKPNNNQWSYPGRRSTLDDWKNYFQAYDRSYNADVILIDGRFKVATAMDMFDKINDDTIVLVHEYSDRPSYFVIEKYYQLVYHWDRIAAFIKKKDVKSIPLEVQQNYWNDPL
jgi:hypothetical protein